MAKVRLVAWLSCVYILASAWNMACAQDYPNKVIRLLATEAAGGTDFVARQIAQGISDPLGHQVIVDNRGNLAAQMLSQALPDGYTLALLGPPLWISPLLQSVPYDPVKSFSPIISAASSANVLIVHPSLPVNTVKDLIAFAKARPGEVNYSSSMTGASNHLAAELFKFMTGVNILRIPYRGAAQALTGVVSGAVHVSFPSAAAAAPSIRSRRLRALAVTGSTPSVVLPDLPTISASGVPGYESVAMYGAFAPAGTPLAIINRLNLEITRFLNRAEIKERFASSGVETVGGSPAQFAAAIAAEVASAGKMIKSTGMRAD